MKIKKGQLIAITTGEYSDYGLLDHVRALRDFDTDQLLKNYRESTKPNSWGSWGYRGEKYLPWVIEQGFVEVLDVGEVVEWWVD